MQPVLRYSARRRPTRSTRRTAPASRACWRSSSSAPTPPRTSSLRCTTSTTPTSRPTQSSQTSSADSPSPPGSSRRAPAQTHVHVCACARTCHAHVPVYMRMCACHACAMHVPCVCHVCAMQHAHAHAVHMPCDAQASTREHALRCMARVGVADLPWRGIIDTRTCRLETKHSPSSFQACNPFHPGLQPYVIQACNPAWAGPQPYSFRAAAVCHLMPPSLHPCAAQSMRTACALHCARTYTLHANCCSG